MMIKKHSRIKTSPAEIWGEFERARNYNMAIDLQERVKRNEDFFLGRQWEGVKAPDTDLPVFNIFKRVINYFIAMMVSDNVGVSLSLFNRVEDDAARVALGVIKEQIQQVFEYNRFGKVARAALRSAAVDGDACIHIYFDPDINTGREGEDGFIKFEEIDAVDVYFGNPNLHDPQEQPFIIFAQRRQLRDLKDELIDDGRPEDAEAIRPDSPCDSAYAEEHEYNDKVTVLTKYWKEGGHVWHAESTHDITVTPPTDTELALYPVAWMSWERVKNCYHGISVIEGLIPNQVSINKMAAMAQEFIKQQAFPRIFYNKQKLDKWVGGIKPIAVNGDPTGVIHAENQNPNMSGQVGEYFSRFMSNTKELMGASDASLGTITNPDNTSAIIATQKATAVPLELQRQEYYQMVEDMVRIIIDQMRARYGKRTAIGKDEEGNRREVDFDFSVLNSWVLSMNVDIGQAAYWSELSGIQTLTQVQQAGLVDPITYLESIPPSYLPQKERIVEEAKRKLAEQKAAQAAAPAAGSMQDMQPGAEAAMM